MLLECSFVICYLFSCSASGILEIIYRVFLSTNDYYCVANLTTTVEENNIRHSEKYEKLSPKYVKLLSLTFNCSADRKKIRIFQMNEISLRFSCQDLSELKGIWDVILLLVPVFN